jgi:hypothetical protein
MLVRDLNAKPCSIHQFVLIIHCLRIHRVKSGRADGIGQAVSCLSWMRRLGDAGDEAARPDRIKVRKSDDAQFVNDLDDASTLLNLHSFPTVYDHCHCVYKQGRHHERCEVLENHGS